jgi:hypothetical protein
VKKKRLDDGIDVKYSAALGTLWDPLSPTNPPAALPFSEEKKKVQGGEPNNM